LAFAATTGAGDGKLAVAVGAVGRAGGSRVALACIGGDFTSLRFAKGREGGCDELPLCGTETDGGVCATGWVETAVLASVGNCCGSACGAVVGAGGAGVAGSRLANRSAKLPGVVVGATAGLAPAGSAAATVGAGPGAGGKGRARVGPGMKVSIVRPARESG
jgi:hypothetical protein